PRTCRTAPATHGTWRARPASARLPTGAPGGVFRRWPGRALLADAADVRHVAIHLHRAAPGWVVVGLVQAEVLGMLQGGLRPLHDDRFQGGRQELGVVNIRPGNHNGERSTAGVDQEAALHPALPTVGRVAADEVPPTGPSPALHRRLAIPSPRR